MLVDQASRRHGSADAGNVEHRHAEPCTPEQPACTEFIPEPVAAKTLTCRVVCAYRRSFRGGNGFGGLAPPPTRDDGQLRRQDFVTGGKTLFFSNGISIWHLLYW